MFIVICKVVQIQTLTLDCSAAHTDLTFSNSAV